MNGKMKRVLPLVLAFVLLTTGACGLYSDDEPAPATTAAATTAAPTTTAAAAADDADAGGAAETTTTVKSGDTTTTAAAKASEVTTTTAAAADSDAAGDKAAERPLAATWPEFANDTEAQFLCFEQGWTGPEKDKDFVAPELARRTGFLLKYESQTVTTDEDLQAKLNLMMTSGQVPDIYFGPSSGYYRDVCRRLGAAGLIWNYAPYIKDYPRIYELMKPELLQHYDPVNKAIYFIPTQNGRGFDTVGTAPHGEPYVRKDYLDKLGMDYPTTPEELYNYLVACRDQLPDVNGKSVIPLCMDENVWGVESLINLFWPAPKMVGGAWGFDPNNNYEFYNYLFTDSDVLMRAAKYVNKLYREGLIDREAITIKRDQFMEKVSSGRVAAVFMPMWDMTTFSDQAKEVVPELFYVAVPDIYDKTNGYPLYPDTKWTNWVGYWSSLTVSTRLSETQFRHFLAMLDYLATTEGQILVQVGVEGVSYEYDSNGKFQYLDDFLQKTDNLDWNKASAYGVFYYQQVVNNFQAYKDIQGVSQELLREEHMAGWINRKSRRDRYDPDMMPYKFQYLVEGEQELALMPAINEAKKMFYANVLSAKDEAGVEKVVRDWAKTCIDLGIETVIQEKIDAMANLVIPTDLDY